MFFFKPATQIKSGIIQVLWHAMINGFLFSSSIGTIPLHGLRIPDCKSSMATWRDIGPQRRRKTDPRKSYMRVTQNLKCQYLMKMSNQKFLPSPSHTHRRSLRNLAASHLLGPQRKGNLMGKGWMEIWPGLLVGSCPKLCHHNLLGPNRLLVKLLLMIWKP